VTGLGGSSQQVALRSYADGRQHTLARFDTAGEACSFGATTRTESVTLYRWDPSAAQLCFRQRQLELECP
ncbi:MAG TPA: hypothetical protein VNW92_08515, partial [Polyangiaceae bacterium]|nr:hypothetical protein [Polyangiaceae bacterium]